MKNIPVDTTRLSFVHFGEVQAAVSKGSTTQRVDRTTGLPLWKVPCVVVAVDGQNKVPEGVYVTVPAQSAPRPAQGAELRFHGLTGRAWAIGSASGVSLTADAVEPAQAKSAS